MNFPIELRPDCTKCCGLCCVGPAFDADQGFGFDKPAHTACRHLKRDYRCAIHPQLALRGFPSCAAFDCHGAGQWVTQQLFGGRSWQSSPELAASMFACFRRYRVLHELMVLLDLAVRSTPPNEARALEECLQRIQGICRSGPQTLATVSLTALRGAVMRLLRAQRENLLASARSVR
jgi:hypothetical protein